MSTGDPSHQLLTLSLTYRQSPLVEALQHAVGTDPGTLPEKSKPDRSSTSDLHSLLPQYAIGAMDLGSWLRWWLFWRFHESDRDGGGAGAVQRSRWGVPSQFAARLVGLAPRSSSRSAPASCTVFVTALTQDSRQPLFGRHGCHCLYTRNLVHVVVPGSACHLGGIGEAWRGAHVQSFKPGLSLARALLPVRATSGRPRRTMEAGLKCVLQDFVFGHMAAG